MFGFNPFSTTGFSELEQSAQSYSLSASAGAYTITGGSASLRIGRKLVASSGSYVISGKAASIREGRVLNGSKGTYLLTGSAAELKYTPIIVEIISKGGLPNKKVKTVLSKSQHDDIAEIVKREFDKLDGTYIPEAIEVAKKEIMPKIQEIEVFDETQYKIALAQVNELLLQIKLRAAEYQAEIEDEEAILMLL